MKKLMLLAIVALFVVHSQGSAVADPARWQAMGWQTDFSKTTVDLSEILSGGPPRDGIPSIDSPVFEPVSEVDRYEGREPVIEVDLEGEVRAYPLSILTWHEIVNDEFNGRPVAVTYCPLCNASVVFDAEVNGETLEFGVSGLLRHSDLIMYDRSTDSWWQQFTGEAIAGDFAGTRLRMLPARVVSFDDFRSRHPDAVVLVPNNPNLRSYGRNPYVAYDSRSQPYPLFQGELPENMDPMARVVVVHTGDGDDSLVAVSLAHLSERGTIEHEGVTLSWGGGVASALDSAVIAQGRDVGAVDAVDSETGERLIHDVTFAFVVQAFHPELRVLTEDGLIALRN